ncbi:MBL fold metallo-hydrolase [Saccharopolyspora sp. HNM0983]|uniref:MBL fold metallo-hydrolase n=1 Tax=Saccharopolyspora montiporae TaxID=2781240 RepID=A0A929BF70_9PSEU|nr:MBL fold metallo-hydrolase [Saccharopolyspora sp. HNM0983]MBE9376458.1 MBL fold metallo-hydrolase [Saccharopolyspora sp. HNM0983]
MRVQHLNCGTMRPPGGRLVNREGGHVSARMVCHCLLLDTGAELVLVDTGLGVPDVSTRTRELGTGWRRLVRPDLDPAETAAAQVRRLGYRTEDVRHVVLTHLDRDHAGGLPDFPHARVHVHETEHAAMLDDVAARRYLPHQFEHGPQFTPVPDRAGESWFGFRAVREIPGLPEDVLLIPLAGHTRGHTGVAVRTGQDWLLHAGDAFFDHREIGVRDRCPPGLRVFRSLIQVDGAQRRDNLDRLRDLAVAQPDRVRVLCSHDAAQFDGKRPDVVVRSAP